jgi:hypothetical protein
VTILDLGTLRGRAKAYTQAAPITGLDVAVVNVVRISALYTILDSTGA